MKPAMPILSLAVAMFVFAMLPNAQGQNTHSIVGSETVVYTFDDSSSINGTSFEARITSDSPLIVSTVLIGTNSGSTPSVSASEWKVYDSSGEPFVYNGSDGSLPVGSDNEIRSIAGQDVLPLGAPAGGSLGIAIIAGSFQQGDTITITFVYVTNAGSTVSPEIKPAIQLPFYVAENSQPKSNFTSLEISDSFVNPEIHCEICTSVNAAGESAAAYVSNATDLTGATKFSFWAMGESGGEDVTFKVAGKSQDGAVVYANTTNVALDNEWRRYEVELAGVDLNGITHLFAFDAGGEETFYVKGAAYY